MGQAVSILSPPLPLSLAPSIPATHARRKRADRGADSRACFCGIWLQGTVRTRHGVCRVETERGAAGQGNIAHGLPIGGKVRE